MLRNHVKIAWRNLLKDRQFTFLNLVGLSTGLACALLIYLWVSDELHIDRYNEKDGQLYQLMQNGKNQNGIETVESTPGLLASSLAKEIPEIQYAGSVIPSGWFSNKGLLTYEDIHIRAGGQFVSKDFFNIFTCPFIEGEQSQLFSDKNNIAISEELAQKLFHTSNPILGKTLEWNQDNFNGIYRVTGVFKKLPANARSQFDLLLNYQLFLDQNPKLQNWENSDPGTYVIVRKGTNLGLLNQKMAGFIKTKDEKTNASLFLQRFSEKYLHNHYENGSPAGGRIEYVRLFTLIALFILTVACINFMNLSTARASVRMKEVGIKKIVGASRARLVSQYLGESLFLAFLSLILAVFLVLLLLPAFNTITGKSLTLYPDSDLVFAISGITLFTGLIAGSYPAIYLSGFKPVSVLKGRLSNSRAETWTRKGMVAFQFILSAVLIVSVLVVYQQMEFVQSKNLGYSRDHILYFDKGGKLSDNKEDYKDGGVAEKSLLDFIDRVKNVPGVIHATNFRHSIINRHGGTTAINWQGKNPNDQIHFTDIAAGYDFIETMGIQMAEGRSFSKAYGSEKSKIIFNEAAIAAMGLTHPIGKTVNVWGEDRQIIGVAKNFHFESLYESLKPCFFDFSLNHRVSRIMVKIKAGTEKTTIAALGKLYQESSGEPFEYKFLDADYQALYASEQRVSILSRYFAGLAILISCLGLFGLAAFTAQKRKKEIGIRKVVGSSVANVILLLSKDFLKLILISLLVAFPLAWWAMSQWLDGFAYRITISVTVFLIAGTSIILITLLTISFQSVKAAMANPVKTLRAD